MLVRHAGGAVSTLALTLDAPPDAVLFEHVFYGSSGFVELPDAETDHVAAFRAAVAQLAALVRDGQTEHPCDVRFGRDVVTILAAAESSLTHGRTIDL